MTEQKIAIVTGCCGQTGSYLTEILLDKGYKVIGTRRRTSSPNNDNISTVINNPNFELAIADITDYSCVSGLVNKYQPNEIYNLAAQSFVKASFDQPFHTFETDTMGVLNFLEVIKNTDKSIKFYQASTSEMFGKSFSKRCIDDEGDSWEMTRMGMDLNFEKYQDESTPFIPQSPYGIAKLAAHHLCRLYRESYGIFAACGILFNHECIKYDQPILIKINNMVYIISIEELAILYGDYDNSIDNKSGNELSSKVEVWDKSGWVNINCISWFKNSDKKLKIINARNSIVSVSDDHVCILDGMIEKKAEEINIGDKVETINYPSCELFNNISLNEAELLGMLVGDGTLSSSEQFTNSDESIRNRFEELWINVANGKCKYYPSISGFTGDVVGRLDLSGGKDWYRKYQIYSLSKDVFGHKYKQIPYQILNSSKDVMEAFLKGYNTCDGLKKNKCKYLFKNFKTNSPILAAGLLYLINNVTGQKYNITIEESWSHGKQQFYYSINLLSDKKSKIDKFDIIVKLLNDNKSIREIHKITGISRGFITKVKNGYIPNNTHHLELCNNEIKKIITVDDYDGMFFDIETSSGTLHGGIGQSLIHNSPRRGKEFVTRKITDYVGWLNRERDFIEGQYDAELYENLPKLKLGNLDAYRDWGFAGDYAQAQYSILQQEKPEDFVICTGETHSVREFCDAAFKVIGLDYNDWVEVDPQFYRPAEVDYLCGDCSKAKNIIDWKPSFTFQQMVEDMVQADIKRYSNGQ